MLNRLLFVIALLLLSKTTNYHGHRTTQLEELEKDLRQISEKYRYNPNCTILLGGDFNCGDISWESHTAQDNTDRKSVCENLIQLLVNLTWPRYTLNKPGKATS